MREHVLLFCLLALLLTATIITGDRTGSRDLGTVTHRMTRKAGEPMIAATRATRQRMGENILIPAPNRPTTALAMLLLKKASRIVVLTV